MKKSGYIANHVFNKVEKLIEKKMKKAELSLFLTHLHGDTIEYWDNQKDLPVLLLLHGFGARTKYQWFKQVEFLSKDYRLILPNLIHFGNSTSPKEDVGVSDQVEMVENLLTSLGIEFFTTMGVSYGGLVGIELAQKNKMKIEQLIIVNSPIKFMLKEDITNVCNRFNVTTVEDLFVPESPKGLKKMWHLSSGKKIYLPDFVFNEFYNRMYAGNRESKRKLMQNLIDSLETFAQHEYNFGIETLLIWSDDDMIIPVQRGRLLKKYLGKKAELHIIQKGGHMVNLNKTKEFNRILMRFLLS